MVASRKHKMRSPGPGTLIPGFGPKTSVALVALGVTRLEELRGRNPIQLYGELKLRDSRVSLNFLYAIVAAQEGCDWREVQRSRRTELLMKLDEMGLAPK